MNELYLVSLRRKEHKGDFLSYEERWTTEHLARQQHFVPVLDTVLIQEETNNDKPTDLFSPITHTLRASVAIEVDNEELGKSLKQYPLLHGKKLILDHLGDKANELHFE
jgi:hypothetical protein